MIYVAAISGGLPRPFRSTNQHKRWNLNGIFVGFNDITIELPFGQRRMKLGQLVAHYFFLQVGCCWFAIEFIELQICEDLLLCHFLL